MGEFQLPFPFLQICGILTEIKVDYQVLIHNVKSD